MGRALHDSLPLAYVLADGLFGRDNVGRNKNDPEFARAPHYYAAVSEWFDRLSLDDQERVHTVVYVYSTATGASRRRLSTPPCCRQRPVPPEIIRKAWGHD
jgi:hypothetical protein